MGGAKWKLFSSPVIATLVLVVLVVGDLGECFIRGSLLLVLAGQEQKHGYIYKVLSFLLVMCPLLVESISPCNKGGVGILSMCHAFISLSAL